MNRQIREIKCRLTVGKALFHLRFACRLQSFRHHQARSHRTWHIHESPRRDEMPYWGRRVGVGIMRPTAATDQDGSGDALRETIYMLLTRAARPRQLPPPIACHQHMPKFN